MSDIKIVQRRFFDWRLVAMLTTAAVVLFGIYAGVQAFKGSAAKDRNTAALIVRNKALFAQNADLIAQIKSQDAADAANIERSAHNQLLLLNYTAQLAAREDALLAYLRRHGIRLPTRLITVIPPPRLQVVSASPKGAKNSKHGKKR